MSPHVARFTQQAAMSELIVRLHVGPAQPAFAAAGLYLYPTDVAAGGGGIQGIRGGSRMYRAEGGVTHVLAEGGGHSWS